MQNSISQNNKIEYRMAQASQTGTQIFHVSCWLFVIMFFLAPDYFGFKLGMLWSAKRITTFLLYFLILFNMKRLNQFWKIVSKAKIPNVLCFFYVLVRIYTGIIRKDFNTIFGDLFNHVMPFYLFLYILKYEIPAKKMLWFIRLALYIVCIEGIFEYFTKINLFNFLNTAKGGNVFVLERFGEVRVAGNQHHSITFGIYILMLFGLTCYSPEKDLLYLFNYPVLFVLVTLNIFMCGSRAPSGMYFFLIPGIVIFSKNRERIKTLMFLTIVIILMAIITVLTINTDFGQSVMRSLTGVWDAVFDTHYALKYGGQFEGSSLYRDALMKVFQLEEFSPWIGKGVSYTFSVVIDGLWLVSGDNNYVVCYVRYAYPGLVLMLLVGVIPIVYGLIGLIKYKNRFFWASIFSTIGYYLSIWYVAEMGTLMEMWFIFAFTYFIFDKFRNQKKEAFNNLLEENRKYNRKEKRKIRSNIEQKYIF